MQCVDDNDEPLSFQKFSYSLRQENIFLDLRLTYSVLCRLFPACIAKDHPVYPAEPLVDSGDHLQ